MTDWIDEMDDATAIRVLKVSAAARIPAGEGPPEVTAEVREALAAYAAPAGEAASEGELARVAVRLLADDPDQAEALHALAAGPAPEAMVGVAATIALAAAVLLVLQAHVEFERDTQGRWRLKIVKKPTSESLLKPIIGKLLGLIGLGG